MSQRGSFVTEYIYCDKCLEAAKAVLCQQTNYLCGQVIDSWADQDGGKMPIIAGKIGDSSDEALFFDLEIKPKLESSICHAMTVVVIPEANRPAVFVIRSAYEDSRKALLSSQKKAKVKMASCIRKLEVVRLAACGSSFSAIGDRLGISTSAANRLFRLGLRILRHYCKVDFYSVAEARECEEVIALIDKAVMMVNQEFGGENPAPRQANA